MKTYKSYTSTIKLVKEPSDILKAKITSSKDCADYARQFYFEDIEIFESMFIILLNRQNITECWVKISQGGTVGTVVDVKLIAKYAIDGLACSVIMVHNHPSGNNQPSDCDKLITDKIKNGLKLLDINLIDHIILTPETRKYYSFADEGLI